MLFTSLIGAVQDKHDLVIENIVGSNIGNMGLILGVAAVVSPVKIQRRLITSKFFLIGVTIVLSFSLLMVN